MYPEHLAMNQPAIQIDQPVSIHAVYERAAFVIDHYAAAYIIKAHDESRGRLPDEIKQIVENNQFDIFAKMGELTSDYHDMQTAFIALNLMGVKAIRFTNTYLHVKTEIPSFAGQDTIDIMTKNEPAVFIPAAQIPKLFRASYENPDDLVQEYRQALGNILPEDFNYWRNICYLTGTRIEYQ